MALWEITLRGQYDYPFIAMSGRHPGTAISMWCLWDRELLQVATRNEKVLKAMEKDIGTAGRIVDQWADAGDGGRVFLLRCTCGDLDSPWTAWEPAGCVDAPPAVFQDGWGYFRLLTFDEESSRKAFKALNKKGPTELVRKREIALGTIPSSVWVSSLFGDLTAKQADALLKAHRYGYYSSPRQITTDTIARGIGLSRSTYEEHLRKAENRVMAALMPYLQVFAASERPLPERAPLHGTALDAAEEATEP
jgi:hypothetical protein